MKLTLKQGEQLVKLARAAIFSHALTPNDFEEKRGVFVTLNSYPSGQLRGCIGFPEPVFKLKDAVVNAARHAAINDPRFMPLQNDEDVTIEVSVLTKPQLIEVEDPKQYPEKINIGEDGLIVKYEGMSGLLLPQVFVDHEVDAKKALQMTCEKAGLENDAWTMPGCKVYKFQAQIFYEKEPGGKVFEKVK
jgi:hypothetical protein